MQAVYHEQYGPPEVLRYGERPDPTPGADDVLIRVRATSLNRVDIYRRAGTHGYAGPLPAILGSDIAGEVVEVGAAVSTFRTGDRVVASGNGAYAQLAVAPAASTYSLPAGCTFEQGGALPTAGRTAYDAVMNRASVRAGEDVLVIAAASGVGSYALQLAKLSGARVIATAGTSEKLERATALGADCVINHYTEDIAERVLAFTGGVGVDVIIEQVGTPVWLACMKSLKPFGRLVTFGITAGHRFDLHLGRVSQLGLQIMGLGLPSEAERRETMRRLLRLVEQGRVLPAIDARYPLAQAAEAHRRMEDSAFFGKIVLLPE